MAKRGGKGKGGKPIRWIKALLATGDQTPYKIKTMKQIKQLNADGIQVMNVCRFAKSVFDPCKTSP
jgi:hypothetical protein